MSIELQTPIAVFGGPYSNLPATQAMKDVGGHFQIPASSVICTGDVVAYCGSPEQTTNYIRNWNCHVVMGNCEESLGSALDDCGCGFDAGSVCAALSVGWYQHANSCISDTNRQWMRSLPGELRFNVEGFEFLVVHGSADNISEFVFESSNPSAKQQQLEAAGVDCIIGGHSGLPFGQRLTSGYWLNSGVIGMPANDGQPSTWYMLIEQQSGQLQATWHRLCYDYKQVQTDMKNAGLGSEYCLALGSGIWPSNGILPNAEQSLSGLDRSVARLYLDSQKIRPQKIA